MLNSYVVDPLPRPTRYPKEVPLPSFIFFLALSSALIGTFRVSTFLGLKAPPQEVKKRNKTEYRRVFFTMIKIYELFSINIIKLIKSTHFVDILNQKLV